MRTSQFATAQAEFARSMLESSLVMASVEGIGSVDKHSAVIIKAFAQSLNGLSKRELEVFIKGLVK